MDCGSFDRSNVRGFAQSTCALVAVDLCVVSLYPKDTYQNRPNGLRKDLVTLLKDMKPGFLRFPGGCIVEGRHLDQRYQWKTTIGDLDERRLIINRWNTEFNWRLTPDYPLALATTNISQPSVTIRGSSAILPALG